MMFRSQPSSFLVGAVLLMLSSEAPVAQAQQEALSNDNIRSAIQLWVTQGEEAEIRYGRIEEWDVSGVSNFTALFDSTVDFSADLSSWNTASVTTLRAAFYNTTNFSSRIASWDVSAVTDMRVMLSYAVDFQSDISSWDVSNVRNMRAAFNGYSYTGEKTDDLGAPETIAISSWKTDSLTDMEGLFAETSYFHTDLTGWTTSKVTNMAFMLESSEHFYGGDLSRLDTSSVEIMQHLFASSVNVRGARDISQWDTSSVTSMERIFYNSKLTFDQGTAPMDTNLFYICWDWERLNPGDLTEAFCDSNAGGFNCACLDDVTQPTINSDCPTAQKSCYNSLGAAAAGMKEGPLVSSAPSASIGFISLVLMVIPTLRYV